MRKLTFALLFLCCGLLLGQTPATGNYTFGTFDSRGFDTINAGNLNVMFSIPIVARTGRGLPFTYSLHYEGLIWTQSSLSGTATWVPDPAWGFQGVLNGTGLKGYLTNRTLTLSCPRPPHYSGAVPPRNEYTGFTYHDEYGRSHLFNYTAIDPCPLTDDGDGTVSGDGSAKDGSGYSLNLNNTSQVLTRTGSVIQPPYSATGSNPVSVTDSNGNQITGNGSGAFTDTLGVTALTISGSNPRTFTYPLTRQPNNASSATSTLSYQTYTVQTHFQCSNIVEYGATSVSLPSRLTLADSSYYQFTYEPTPGVSGAVTGRLASVTLPTGGTISYSYSGGCNGSGMNADGTFSVLTRATSDGTRQYTRSGNNPSSSFTDLVDEKGSDTRYTFSVDAASSRFFETHRQVHQGSTQGPILEDRTTCYNGASNCDGAAVTLPFTETDVTQSFNGGTQSLTKNMYDPAGSLLTASTLYLGQSVWTTTGNTYNTLGEITSTVQKDGNGTQYAGTTYSYDEVTPTATSGVAQHTAASGARGNLTSVHVSTGSTTLNSSTAYYDTGQPASSTAQDGGVTTYGYDGTQGFVTSTSLPTPSSGVALSTSAQFDPNTTAPISSTGMNADTTTVNQYDGFMRPTDMSLPSGSHITVSYTPNQSWVYQTLDANRTAQTVTLMDAYNRLSRTARYNGQSDDKAWYQVDYCYDSTGLLQFQSSPYQSSGFNVAKRCFGSGTAYQYDALGRVTSVTNDDGTASTTYQSRAVKTVDVNGISKITQYDIMGRVTGVCEISSTSYAGQSPTGCGMDIAGSGYVTGYAYYLSTHVMNTTQGNQTRTFQTDWVDRPISATEPERGNTGYDYAFNGYGLQVTRTWNKANQTNTGVKTNTIAQFDKMSRLISVNYDDNLTPTKTFYYDANPSNAAGSGWGTPANLKGRLVVATTSASANSAPITNIQYSYDVPGNIVNVAQCAPSICGGTAQQSRRLQYTYDLGGALMSATDYASGNISYSRSVAGEVRSVLQNTFVDARNPQNLVSNLTNTVSGPSAWNFGNGVQAVRTYDSMGRTNGIFDCTGTTQTYCSGGATIYGNALRWSGSRPPYVCDDTFGANCRNASYDDLNRLTALTSSEGSSTYSYDRYGNRVVANGVSYSFNSNTNQQVNNGYDAVGNQLADATHSYTYDADGKILKVDGGTTATYVYDALDHRVRVTTSSSDQEFLFDQFGRRWSTWNVSTNSGVEGRIYWDYGLLAHRAQDAGTYFHHRNYLGTERARTDWSGTLKSTVYTDPFGTGGAYPSPDSGANQDNNGFTSQDHDPETSTDHFQYRQYSETSGRWMSPDPYDGSYSIGDPQSLNRYAYAHNNPLSYIDPDGTSDESSCDIDGCIAGEGEGPGQASDSSGQHVCIGATCGRTDANPNDASAPPTPPPVTFFNSDVYYWVPPAILRGTNPGSSGSAPASSASPSAPKAPQPPSKKVVQFKSQKHACAAGVATVALGTAATAGAGIVTVIAWEEAGAEVFAESVGEGSMTQLHLVTALYSGPIATLAAGGSAAMMNCGKP